ncbi:MAG: hypothetical protein HY063_04620 [Bacteroidetes bacterium]|nr:hypothetical protein [Bacteroidota bacterium]
MLNITSDKPSLIYNWFSDFEKANLMLCFKGDFNQDLVNAILLLAETKNEYHDNKTQVKSRVFSIMVECMQNICKYGTAPEENGDLKPGIILVGRKENSFFIKTGNLIKNSEVEKLEARLKQLSGLSREELKALHKKTLSETILSEKSGAGLGLVSIARKAEKFSYEFRKLDERATFFSLESIVASN